MKRIFFYLFFLTIIAQAQVGIGTTQPNAALDIADTNYGVLIPRIALTGTDDTTTITNPQSGSIVTGH